MQHAPRQRMGRGTPHPPPAPHHHDRRPGAVLTRRMTTTIPLIDISPFLHGGDAERRAVAKAVNAACADIGFLLVCGHGIPASLIDRMRSVSTAFFARPLEEKLRYRMPADRYRGFIALGNE